MSQRLIRRCPPQPRRQLDRGGKEAGGPVELEDEAGEILLDDVAEPPTHEGEAAEDGPQMGGISMDSSCVYLSTEPTKEKMAQSSNYSGRLESRDRRLLRESPSVNVGSAVDPGPVVLAEDEADDKDDEDNRAEDDDIEMEGEAPEVVSESEARSRLRGRDEDEDVGSKGQQDASKRL